MSLFVCLFICSVFYYQNFGTVGGIGRAPFSSWTKINIPTPGDSTTEWGPVMLRKCETWAKINCNIFLFV